MANRLLNMLPRSALQPPGSVNYLTQQPGYPSEFDPANALITGAGQNLFNRGGGGPSDIYYNRTPGTEGIYANAPIDWAESAVGKRYGHVGRYQEMFDYISKWIRNKYRGSEFVEDMVQDAAEHTWKAYQKNPDVERKYLFRVAENKIYDRLVEEGLVAGRNPYGRAALRSETIGEMEVPTAGLRANLEKRKEIPFDETISTQLHPFYASGRGVRNKQLRETGKATYEGEKLFLGRRPPGEQFEDFVNWLQTKPQFDPYVPKGSREGTFFTDNRILAKMGFEDLIRNLDKDELMFFKSRLSGDGTYEAAKKTYPNDKAPAWKVGGLRDRIAEKISKYVPAALLGTIYNTQENKE